MTDHAEPRERPYADTALELLQCLMAALAEQVAESAATGGRSRAADRRALEQQSQDAADLGVLAQACQVVQRRKAMF